MVIWNNVPFSFITSLYIVSLWVYVALLTPSSLQVYMFSHIHSYALLCIQLIALYEMLLAYSGLIPPFKIMAAKIIIKISMMFYGCLGQVYVCIIRELGTKIKKKLNLQTPIKIYLPVTQTACAFFGLEFYLRVLKC